MSRPCSDSYYVQLVYEYLLHMGMENTASQFKQDCEASNFPVPDEPEGIKRRHISELLQLFDDENELLFFKVFNSVIPQELQYSLECKILMADLLVYFAALSILKQDGYDGNISFKPLVHVPPRITQHFEARPMLSVTPNNMRRSHSRTDYETLEQYDVQYGKGCGVKYCNCAQSALHSNTCAANAPPVRFIEGSDRKVPLNPAMRALLGFLEKECSNLKDHPHFAPYFALPFVAHPQTNPRFKHLFQDSWVANLRRKLWDFLVLHRQAAKIPDVVLLLPSNEVHHQEVNFSHPIYSEITHKLGSIPKKFPYIRERELVSKNPSSLSFDPPPDHCVPEALSTHLPKIEHDLETVSDSSNNSFCSFESSLRKDSVELLDTDFPKEQISPGSHKVSGHISDRFVPPFKFYCHSIQYIPCRKIKSNPAHLDHIANMIRPAVQAMDNNGPFIVQTDPNYENLKLQYHQLHSDYHNLIGVAAELTGALENSLRGHQIDIKQILKNCNDTFPDLFKPNSNFDFAGKAVNILSLHAEESDSEPYFELDMNLIKSNLADGNVKGRLLLLQALRWRITRTSRKMRESTIRMYVKNDLLDLNEDGNSILESLLLPPNVQTPHPLQQTAARFINALASLKPGRDYLAQSSHVVSIISLVLKKHQNGALIDRITEDMLIASLQKLSLRFSQRVAMIDLGLMEWLVQHMTSMENHHPYTLEYSSALLMNLCLHLPAKQRIIPIAESVFILLLDLLSTPVSQALPYINGTMYSLLTHSELNKIAAQMGLAALLEDKILVQKNPHIQEQLEYILLFHIKSSFPEKKNTPPQDACGGEMIDDDNEEIDLLEEELDDNDPVQNIKGELCGNTLLSTHYAISTQVGDGSAFESTAAMIGFPVSFMLIRPSTPLYCQNTLSEDSEGVVTHNVKKDKSSFIKETRRIPIRQTHISNKSESIREQTKRARFYSSKRSTPRAHSSSRERKLVAMTDTESPLENRKGHQIEESKTKAETFSQDELRLKSPCAKAELPMITVDYASTRERSSDENDSEDVKVGFTSLQYADLILANSMEHSDIRNAEDQEALCTGVSVEKSDCEKQCTDGAAFESRPKIPRTPPH